MKWGPLGAIEEQMDTDGLHYRYALKRLRSASFLLLDICLSAIALATAEYLGLRTSARLLLRERQFAMLAFQASHWAL